MTDLTITLTSGSTVITLTGDLQWSDEMTPWKVAQVYEHTLTGALLVSESGKLAGRPITLQSGADFGWVPRSTILQLQDLAAVANGPVMTLSLPDYPIGSGTRDFSVRFRRDTGAIESAQLKHRIPPAPTDWCSLVLRLMQVS